MGGPEPELPAVGATLAGKYRLVRVIGEGGMGVVYEAMHQRLRQPCAIKILQPSVFKNAEVVARFEREARAAANLKDPNVVQVLDVDATPEGLPYLVMELLEGHDLADELDARERIPVQEAVTYAVTTCAALVHAHSKGIVHRDLKPSNLFLSFNATGDTRTLKLLDFGISKVAEDGTEPEGHVTSSLAVMGTPFYMSPEQVRSLKSIDHRTDQWSLAVVLYQLLTGRLPFEGTSTAVVAAIAADPVPSPRTFAPHIPADLEAVIMRALEKDPTKRFEDARAFAEALLPFTPEGMELPAALRSSVRLSFPQVARRARRQPSHSDLELAETQDISSPSLPEDTGSSKGGAAGRSPTTARSAWSGPSAARRRRLSPYVAAAAAVAVLAGGGLALSLHRRPPQATPAHDEPSALARAPSAPSSLPAAQAALPAAPPASPAVAIAAKPSAPATATASSPPTAPPHRHAPRSAAKPSPAASAPAATAPAAPAPAPALTNPLTL